MQLLQTRSIYLPGFATGMADYQSESFWLPVINGWLAHEVDSSRFGCARCECKSFAELALT